MSDEELLNDTTEVAVSAFSMASEPIFTGNGKILDEDALLAGDEAGIRAIPGFANSSSGMIASNDEEISKLTAYGDGTDFGDSGFAHGDTQEGQEQSMEQEDQPKNSENCERTGVISLTPTTRRESIPEKLEINKEQAAQLKQFLSDKSHRGRGKTRGQGRPNSHTLLGMRPGLRQHNPQMILGQFLRGVLGQQPRMGFHFPGGPPNRGPYQTGILNSHGPFPMRPLNQRGLFAGGPQTHRGSFAIGSGNPRGSLNASFSGPQRGPVLNMPPGRFPGTPNQRGLFPGGPQPLLSHRMPTGPQPIRGLPPNQLRLQGFPNQRGANPNQFRQQPPFIGQQGMRGPLSGPGMPGPRPLLGSAGPRPLIGSAGSRPLLGNAGVRPLLGSAGRGMKFNRDAPPGAVQQGQCIPSLMNQVANALNTSMGFQQLRPGQPNSLMMPNAGMRQPGPMQNINRFHHPIGQPTGPPRFMARTPVPGGQFMNSPMFRGGRQPLLGGQGFQMAGKQKFFINPRFPGQQTAFGAAGMGRTFRMGLPVQQRKAKMLLDRAIQNRNKQGITPMKLTGIKRKSTGGEDVPSKVGKPDENTHENSEVPSATVVQADSVC